MNLSLFALLILALMVISYGSILLVEMFKKFKLFLIRPKDSNNLQLNVNDTKHDTEHNNVIFPSKVLRLDKSNAIQTFQRTTTSSTISNPNNQAINTNNQASNTNNQAINTPDSLNKQSLANKPITCKTFISKCPERNAIFIKLPQRPKKKVFNLKYSGKNITMTQQKKNNGMIMKSIINESKNNKAVLDDIIKKKLLETKTSDHTKTASLNSTISKMRKNMIKRKTTKTVHNRIVKTKKRTGFKETTNKPTTKYDVSNHSAPTKSEDDHMNSKIKHETHKTNHEKTTFHNRAATLDKRFDVVSTNHKSSKINKISSVHKKRATQIKNNTSAEMFSSSKTQSNNNLLEKDNTGSKYTIIGIRNLQSKKNENKHKLKDLVKQNTLQTSNSLTKKHMDNINTQSFSNKRLKTKKQIPKKTSSVNLAE
ncbi:hypothetical protein CDIK_0626 [Cucumispora dikerogammari]|nr:hypothetical protein CDIK_0626 [Cucumispora dikerogammari]